MVVLVGSLGFYLLLDREPSFIDCLYMTVITLTGVGYGEIVPVTGHVYVQWFTMFIIIFGMGVILYGISNLTALLIEGQLSGIIRKNRMKKMIEKLNDHYIVCGGGQIGRPLTDELVKNKEPVVMIEWSEEKIALCRRVIPSLLYIRADATEDRNLIEAGIERARGLIICLSNDKDNLYVTMTARMLNKDIRIISRMLDRKLEPKLRMAGADRCVSPDFIGALRMASEIIRPTVVDFLDRMLRSRQGTLRIHQIDITDTSEAVGKTIFEVGLKNRFGLLVLGTKRKGEDIEFNPPPTHVISHGMELIVMGDVENIARARAEI